MDEKENVSFQKEVAKWARETFPNSSNVGRLSHLHDEVMELIDAPHDANEMADVYLILLHHADAHGVDLEKAAREKFEIVKTREWGEPDERGVIRHIEP